MRVLFILCVRSQGRYLGNLEDVKARIEGVKVILTLRIRYIWWLI
jgi:hypothetical protein